MSEQKSGVEMLWDFLIDTPNPFSLGDCAVPEGCFEMFGPDGRRYSVSVEDCGEVKSVQEVQAAVSGPPATPTPAEDSKPNKLSEEFMREAEEAVRKAEKEIEDFKNSNMMRSRTQFEAITMDLTDHPVVLCHAEGLEDLFDKLSQWHVEGMLGLYEQVMIVRAMRDAKQSGWDHGLDCDFTKPFEINEDMPTIIIQMS